MICALGLFDGDVGLAKELLSWCADLGGCPNHDVLLVIDDATQWSEVTEAITLAQKAFRSATTLFVPTVQGWIPGANALWSAAARWCEGKGEAWFWLESDAVPLEPGWLDKIEEVYLLVKTPFMGAIIKGTDPRQPPFFMEGVACYPAQAWSRMQAHLSPTEAWVTSCAPVVMPLASSTPLIQQFWGQEGTPPRFVPFRTASSAPQDWTLENLRKGAVLFHREKSGELIGLLRRRLFPDQPDYSRPPAWIQMGRVGDLILLMPAWQAWAERSGKKTVVITSKEFGQVLEGASYIQPILLPYSWYDAAKARQWAQARYGQVIVTQLHGTGLHTPPDDLPSFSLTMWRRTGLAEEYATLPLTFDQRNPNREANLLARVLTNAKPFVLIKTDAWTSPFDGSNEVRAIMREVFKDEVQIVDLDKVVAHRVFDLLALIDKAIGLVTVDTMCLHLASASPTEYVAFTRDDGQSGSIPKGNNCLQIGYGQWDNQRYPFELQMKLWLAKAYRGKT